MNEKSLNRIPILWFVIPCYNEQDVLPITAPQFLDQLRKMTDEGLVSEDSAVLFVDDGSTDSTWDIILDLSARDSYFRGIRQSRNRGHQSSVLAGLMEAKKHCDITVSIDCDGQDDLSASKKMVEEYLNGSEIVYGVRSSRQKDTWIKRSSALAFYGFMKRLGVDMVYNHADYRLVSVRVLDHFEDYHEVNLFLRGMFPLVGFKSTSIYYNREERVAGRSHYTLGKMFTLAIDGITSLSIKPIRIICVLGLLFSFLGVAGIIWAVAAYILGRTVAGWASLVCIISLLGGLQMLSLGIIGEYVGKTYLETKARPRFIISEKTWEDKIRQPDEQDD